MVATLADRYPDVDIVVDHMAFPDETTDPQAAPWADFEAVADHENVAVKVSSLPRSAERGSSWLLFRRIRCPLPSVPPLHESPHYCVRAPTVTALTDGETLYVTDIPSTTNGESAAGSAGRSPV